MTVPSPCRRECRLSPKGDVCLACRRTISEITRWSTMGEAEQRSVLDRLRGEACS
ncbi:DUF1289 domain-containing protein [Aureimonas jatrophae]|uniref:DUF1289 domain-containing protein n=1 Tax=Aureimonas jatrophae TaxID=1166073 RepID=UPI000B88F438|nr:DUF1289 domain-containing protein [Aureimonas jatrophae]